MLDFSKIKTVHFIGIGGIGTSAVARMFVLEGKKVSGSDVADSELLEDLRKEGAEIVIGQSLESVAKDAELIIYSAAIEVAEPELFRAVKKLKTPSLSYAEALGVISECKTTIAVSGTHGKTTTTAMVAKILMDAGLEPTVIIGSLIDADSRGHTRGQSRTNYIAGKSDYLVVEADEYQRSFLKLKPAILVITNIDADHLDYYRDLADVQSAFAELAAKVPKTGAIVTDLSNPKVGPAVAAACALVLDYSSADISSLKLPVPGEHNRANARAALKVADFLGVPREKSIAALNDFKSPWRRFEYKGETAKGAMVYDDYAHNPQKVRAVLAGTREMFPDKKIVAVFQPHLYSRTKTSLHEFAESFADADEVIFLPIFPAREKFDFTISSETLLQKTQAVYPAKMLRYSVTFEDAAAYLENTAGNNHLILTIGAGDIYKLANVLVGE